MIAPAEPHRAGAPDDEPRRPRGRATIVGAIMLVSRRPGRARPPGDQVVLAEHVVQVDPGARDDDPEPEPVEDESDAALPSRVDDRDVRRAPAAARLRARRARAPRSARAPPRASSGESRREAAAMQIARNAARARVCSRITSTRAAIASACPAGRARQPLEQRQAVGDQDPPDDGGGFDDDSCPWKRARTGRRQTTR